MAHGLAVSWPSKWKDIIFRLLLGGTIWFCTEHYLGRSVSGTLCFCIQFLFSFSLLRFSVPA